MSQFGSWVCLGPKHLHRLRNIHVSTGQVEVRDEMGSRMVQVVGTEALHLNCVPGLPRLLDTLCTLGKTVL